MTFPRSSIAGLLYIALLIQIVTLRKAHADPASTFANHRQGASRKLAQTTNVNVNIHGVAASKGPAQGQPLPPPSPSSPPSPPSPPPSPPGQVNTNVQVSPAGQGGVNVVVKTPPVSGPQTAVDVNVPGFFTGFIEVGR